ncbi:hypothetical protein SDC9_205602 [bioreactor metagenome]|uniref:Uncharacterized protein n=1 Tax=bioreactor metagenome TaxID=1076179 RepID=A0A645J387_9ZZZZ
MHVVTPVLPDTGKEQARVHVIRDVLTDLHIVVAVIRTRPNAEITDPGCGRGCHRIGSVVKGVDHDVEVGGHHAVVGHRIRLKRGSEKAHACRQGDGC